MLGKTEGRLALVLLITATIPLAVAVVLVNSLFSRASNIWLNPDVEQQLNRGVDVYKDYVKVVKDDMRHQGDAIAADATLREAARGKDDAKLGAVLEAIAPKYPALLALDVKTDEGDTRAHWDRGRPLDDEHERKLPVPRPLGEADGAPQIVATFSFDRRFENDLDRAGSVRDTYAQFDKVRDDLYEFYVKVFVELFGGTVLVTVTIGFIFARGITRRINRLAKALDRVAAGDLDVRVPVTGSDELTELASVFNRMLGEMQTSRARIEFLQRIGAWQEMAQRLAHEIKNPLTPIQLAVQECHRKYAGDDAKYRHLLDTTLEIVEEEVGTLRRLVGNFSSFARLPQAELEEADLRDFLRECAEQLGHLEDASASADASGESEAFGLVNVTVEWEIPTAPLPAAIDRQMLRRVFVNLVRNAVHAIRDARGGAATPAEQVIGRVVVSARVDGDGAAISVDDDGPGVPEELRARVFDPYFTTKSDGTGLGLAIVKKIVVEHGGSVDCEKSVRLGGARFVVRLPGPQSAAISAAASAFHNRAPRAARSREPRVNATDRKMTEQAAFDRQRMAPTHLVLVAVLVVGFALVPRAMRAMFKSGEGGAAPAFTLPLLANDGAAATGQPPLALEDLRGKVVLLDFWASWCGPCQIEAPLVNKVAQRFKDRGVVAIGINTGDQPARGRTWALSRGLTFPIVHDDDDATARAYGVDSLPTLVVISRTGKVVATRTGVTDDAELDALVRQSL